MIGLLYFRKLSYSDLEMGAGGVDFVVIRTDEVLYFFKGIFLLNFY